MIGFWQWFFLGKTHIHIRETYRRRYLYKRLFESVDKHIDQSPILPPHYPPRSVPVYERPFMYTSRKTLRRGSWTSKYDSPRLNYITVLVPVKMLFIVYLRRFFYKLLLVYNRHRGHFVLISEEWPKLQVNFNRRKKWRGYFWRKEKLTLLNKWPF